MAEPARVSAADQDPDAEKPGLRVPGRVRRRREYTAALIEAERKRAYDEGYAAGVAACKAARCRLKAVGGGKAAEG